MTDAEWNVINLVLSWACMFSFGRWVESVGGWKGVFGK